AVVTPGMFALLGRGALIGRTFRDEDVATSPVILSYQCWTRRLGGDPAVVGRTIQVAGSPASVTVIGVMPQDFVFPYRSMLGASGFTRAFEADAWLPLSRQRDPRLVDSTGQPNRSVHYLAVIARMKPGVSIERVRTDVSTIATRRAADF